MKAKKSLLVACLTLLLTVNIFPVVPEITNVDDLTSSSGTFKVCCDLGPGDVDEEQ